MTEITRRAVALGYARSMTRQWVMQPATSDPAWPVPQVEWQRVGRYWLIPWDDRLKSRLAARNRNPGPKGWSSPTSGSKTGA